MASPGLFERALQRLFGSGSNAGGGDAADSELIDDLIAGVVEQVEPRVKLVPRYEAKLREPMRATLAHLRALAAGAPEPLALTRAAWADDPRVNAFFAAPDEVSACLGRSRELRAFFDDAANAGASEAYALLGMKKAERRVLAPGYVGDMLVQDLAQVTVSFSDHSIVAPSRSAADTRLEIGRRIVERLAQPARSRVLEAKARKATLDQYLDEIRAAFEHPENQVAVSRTPLRVSRMGVKLDASSTERANELVLTELAIGADVRPVIAAVRCPRSEMPPKEDRYTDAERLL